MRIRTQVQNLSSTQVRELRAECEKNFWFFANATTDAGFYGTGIHDELCAFLQKPSRRKLVVMPRSFLKTTFVTRYALWRALKNPSIRILVTSNTSTNAEKTVMEIMGLVSGHPLISALWPELIPDFNKTRWSAQKGACLKRARDYPEATFEAAGVGTAIIRRHYNLIVEDDTVAPSIDDMNGEVIAPTREEIDKAVGFHKMLSPLLIDARTDEKLTVGTRWGSEDLISYVLEQNRAGGEQFDTFDRPATSDGTLDSKPSYHRYPISVLKEIQQSVGSFLFESLYMNNPLPKEFMSFKQDWFRYWGAGTGVDWPEHEQGLHLVTVDPADEPTGKSTQDYTAICSAKMCKYGLFVRRSSRARLSGLEIIRKSLDVAFEDNADAIRVEVDRYAYLKDVFRDEMNRRGKWLDVQFEKTGGRSKEGRILALQPFAESGRLFLPSGGSCRNLEFELVTFPKGKHDDEADALAWQLYNFHMQAEAAVLPASASTSLPGFSLGHVRTEKARPWMQVKLEDILAQLDKKQHYRRARSPMMHESV